MSGFIAIHRMMLDHPLFEGDSSRAGAWVWLLARACWREMPFDLAGKIITLERGQLCASRAQMARAWGWSPSSVERFLARLETEHMIGRATGQGRSIITICNYTKYQDINDVTGQATGQATGQPPDSHRTAKEQGNKETIEPNGSNIPPNPRKKSGSKWSTIERPDGIDTQVWADFETHRKSKDAPITATVMKAFLREAAKLRWPLERAIVESIERNWRGFKADWVKDKGNGNGNRSTGKSGDGFFDGSMDLARSDGSGDASR